MQKPIIVPISNYFDAIFNQATPSEIIHGADELSSNITSQFAAFFADPVYCSLHLHDKTTIAFIYKCILQIVIDTRDDAIRALPGGRIESITVPDEIGEEYGGDINSYIEAVKLCQNSFRALLRQDIGDDLELNGYINTVASDLNEALLEFFTDVFRVGSPEVFVEKVYGNQNGRGEAVVVVLDHEHEDNQGQPDQCYN